MNPITGSREDLLSVGLQFDKGIHLQDNPIQQVRAVLDLNIVELTEGKTIFRYSSYFEEYTHIEVTISFIFDDVNHIIVRRYEITEFLGRHGSERKYSKIALLSGQPNTDPIFSIADRLVDITLDYSDAWGKTYRYWES